MKSLIVLSTLSSLAMLTSPASAQVGAGEQDDGRGPPPAMIAQMQAREADDMALLLNLRPQQRPALTAFLQSIAPPPRPMQDPHAPEGPRPAPPTDGFAQHLDRMTQDAARHSADDTRRITAARTFYDALDPAQRSAFEALMRLRHGPGPRGPMHGGDGPPPPMGGMPRRP